MTSKELYQVLIKSIELDKAGDFEEQDYLGNNYYYEEQNYEEAVKYSSLSAEQKNVEAQYYLSTCYTDGLRVKRSPGEANK